MVKTRNVVEEYIALTDKQISRLFSRLDRFENELSWELKSNCPSVEVMAQITERMVLTKNEIANEEKTMSMLRDILDIVTTEENAASAG